MLPVDIGENEAAAALTIASIASGGMMPFPAGNAEPSQVYSAGEYNVYTPGPTSRGPYPPNSASTETTPVYNNHPVSEVSKGRKATRKKTSISPVNNSGANKNKSKQLSVSKRPVVTPPQVPMMTPTPSIMRTHANQQPPPPTAVTSTGSKKRKVAAVYAKPSNEVESKGPAPDEHYFSVKPAKLPRAKEGMKLYSDYFLASRNLYKARLSKHVRYAQVLDREKTAGSAANAKEFQDKSRFSFKQDGIKALGQVLDVFCDSLFHEAIRLSNTRAKEASHGSTDSSPCLSSRDVQDALLSLGFFSINVYQKNTLRR